ncbi:MAG: Glycosyl transferase family 2, partial [Candidatus Woesebacteria bacterium GW2011_GWB1_38_5]
MDKYIINIYTSSDISWRTKVYLKKIGRLFTGNKNVSVPMGAVFNKRNRYEKNNIVYETYNGLEKEFSAFETLTDGQKLYWSIVIISLLILGLINIHFMLVLIVGSLTFIYFADFLFTLLIIARSFANKSEIKFTNDELVELDDFTLPRYTILCPLYKEWEVIEQFVRSIEIIDWPKDKLEVILLLEEDDTKTINKAYDLNLPSYFRIEVVPNSLPKTKPKACNYGLSKTTGEFVVVYDA